MNRSRSGFSLIEMLMVIVIIGVVVAFGLPKFNSLRNSGKVGSAKVQLASGLVTARAAAIQNSRPARWSLSGNTVTITRMRADGTYENVMAPYDYNITYGTSLSSTASTINFDSRGMANGLNSTVKVYVRGATTDSVCVTVLGVVLRNGCV